VVSGSGRGVVAMPPRRRSVRTQAMDPNSVASSVGVLLGAAFVASQLVAEQADMDRDNGCPTCEGERTVECMCARWSDEDVGCGVCAGTGRMICMSCRGGGTKVPIASRVYVEKSSGEYRPRNDQY